MKHLLFLSIALAGLSFAATGARAAGQSDHGHAHAQQSPVPNALPLLVVNRSPSCGCCLNWVAHMREAGFTVEVRNVADMGAVKARLGVPDTMRSCHTGEVDGYFVEGHVPADDIKRLLTERPDALGLAVPGMPMGSPGMEHPAGHAQPYDVMLVDETGNSVHSSHGGGAAH